MTLVDAGLNDCQIERLTGIPRRTVLDWRHGRGASLRAGDSCSNDPADLPSEQYAYLLGLYLGDGNISAARRGVWRLRITLDRRYPGIIAAAGHSMECVVPGKHAAYFERHDGKCTDVNMYWKHWPCLFPQHGPGLKHRRKIELVDWQRAIVEAERQAFLCGLIDSDGCRIIATYREPNRIRKYGRYIFSNRSDDIRGLFCDSLDAIGIHWTRANAKDVAVARQRDVRRLDSFIGFKE